MDDIKGNDPSALIPHSYCEGCGLELPPARKNRRYHDSACKQEGYRKRRMKALEELLQEACCILNSYADIVTWDDDLQQSKRQLYSRINEAFGITFISDEKSE
jgi:hypothetical protein